MALVEDRGGEIRLATGDTLALIPAHFLHSEGNFTVWDRRSRIAFSGDIGAAVFGSSGPYLFVEDFQKHRSLMEGFHRRYMNGQKACEKWVDLVRRLEPNMIAPQHGAIFQGGDVGLFLGWLAGLRCGLDILDEIYGG
jgi:flavorubredoxin